MEGFYGQKQEGTRSGLINLIFLRGKGRVCVADYLIEAIQKVPNWLAKTTFLEEVERVIRLGMKTWFGDVSLAQVIPFGSVVPFW